MPDLPDPDALRREGIARGLRILELDRLIDETQVALQTMFQAVLVSLDRLGERKGAP